MTVSFPTLVIVSPVVAMTTADVPSVSVTIERSTGPCGPQKMPKLKVFVVESNVAEQLMVSGVLGRKSEGSNRRGG